MSYNININKNRLKWRKYNNKLITNKNKDNNQNMLKAVIYIMNYKKNKLNKNIFKHKSIELRQIKNNVNKSYIIIMI